jgi:hypothetical protein
LKDLTAHKPQYYNKPSHCSCQERYQGQIENESDATLVLIALLLELQIKGHIKIMKNHNSN